MTTATTLTLSLISFYPSVNFYNFYPPASDGLNLPHEKEEALKTFMSLVVINGV